MLITNVVSSLRTKVDSLWKCFKNVCRDVISLKQEIDDECSLQKLAEMKLFCHKLQNIIIRVK